MIKTVCSIILTVLFLSPSTALPGREAPEVKPFGIVLHGGAGAISPDSMSGEEETAYRQKLEEALNAGYLLLEQGGNALDAVTAAIVVLEESPLFNAGKGAVFSADGINELDASIMDGKTLGAGAVTGVTTVKSPITLARTVMEKSDHVFLSGTGAERFAKERGLEIVPRSYFFTEKRWQQLQKIRQSKNLPLLSRSGTVGAVALDRLGNLAAGTSTGGMTFKRYGRIGDSPVIGAGTYANNQSCAVSATGHGEYFIRLSVAHEIHALMSYKGMTLKEAADKVIHDRLTSMDGTGGVVAIDGQGNVAMPFNTTGMFRGYRLGKGPAHIAIFAEAAGSAST